MEKDTKTFIEESFIEYAGSIPYELNELRFSSIYNEVAIDILEDICIATGVFKEGSADE